MSNFTAVFVLATAAICATACNKATDDKPGVTNTTSVELPSNPTVAAPEPAKDDYLSTVRREQIALKTRLDDAMSGIDHQVSDLRRTGHIDSAEAHDLMDRRATLAADSEVVSKSDERGWDELKATVEHDLEEP